MQHLVTNTMQVFLSILHFSLFNLQIYINYYLILVQLALLLSCQSRLSSLTLVPILALEADHQPFADLLTLIHIFSHKILSAPKASKVAASNKMRPYLLLFPKMLEQLILVHKI